MNWTGKLSVFCVTVFALALTGLFVNANAEVLTSRAGDGEESAFFYPSYPLEGGPRIIAATLWDASETEGDGSDVDSLIVVFNETLETGIDYEPVSLELEDFVFTGFTVSGSPRLDIDTGGRMVVFAGVSGCTPGVDSVGVLYQAIHGADGSLSKDIGNVVVGTGPVIVHVEFDQNFDSYGLEDPYFDNSPFFTVTFDHDIAAVGALNTIFKTTPEFSSPQILLTNAIVDGRKIEVRRNATGDSLLWAHPGVAKMWLAGTRVRWTTDANNSLPNFAQKVVVDNQGPEIMAAYYNPHGTPGDQSDDEVFLVFDQPVNPESVLQEEAETQYWIGWDYTMRFTDAATQTRAPSGAAYANVLVISSPLTNDGALPTNPDNEFILNSAFGESGHPLSDYQNVLPPRARKARCSIGTGIIRAAYIDRGTATAADDQLHLWFSEELDLADVTAFDFELVPYVEDWQGEITFQAENVNQLGHVIITGWDAVTAFGGARMPDGYFVKIAEDDAFDGLESTDGADGTSLLPIFDDSRPTLIRLEEVPSLTYKRFNTATEADTAFLAWLETSLEDDSDEYFLFFTNQDGTQLDDLFIRNYRQNAISVGNLTPVTIDGGVQRIALDIAHTPGNETTDGHQIEWGNQLRFMLVPATYWGVMADGDTDAVLIFDRPIIAGPVCPPQDFDENDDDMIHVVAVYDEETGTWTYSIYGDANAAPCGDMIHIFASCDDPTEAIEIGSGPIHPNGSFGDPEGDPYAEIVLDMSGVDPEDLPLQWVCIRAEEDGAYSDPLQIRMDAVLPALVNGTVKDLFNPFRIYKADDYVNIILKANDGIGDPEKPGVGYSDLLEVTADFTFVDDREESITPAGTFPTNAIPMKSMGSDELDNDGDWEANNVAIDLDDDGEMDFPEPYVDENGDGGFDPGETFFDRDGDDLCDCWNWDEEDRTYDLNLDSQDADEHSWYEIRLLAPADEPDFYNDVLKGFQVTDPVTDPTGMESFGEMFNLPVPFALRDTYFDATGVIDEDATPFKLEMDEVAPTVSKVTKFMTAPAFGAAADPNESVIIPTDPVYHMGRYLDFWVETPSDDDVLFTAVQIREQGRQDWEPLTLDPPGVNADADAPGIADFDDDHDVSWFNLQTNGVDDDEDGAIDEAGEGIDFADPQVVDANQTETEDADNPAGDGIYRQNDRRDNDNDAFFVFEPYWDVDSGTIYHRFLWYNIDETNDNDIDDDNDGVVDEAGEVETYAALSDDNEDGIQDGESVPIEADPARVVLVSDEAYDSYFGVAAPLVLGDAPAGMPADVVNDLRGLTEVRNGVYGLLDANANARINPPAYPWGDAVTAKLFKWGPLHESNVDWWQIAQLYFGEIPDGTQEYDLRAVAHDQPGNFNADYSVPITFTVDVTPPDVDLAQCAQDAALLCEAAHLELSTVNDEDAASVLFQARWSLDGGVTWVGDDGSNGGWGVNWNATDESRPFVVNFDWLFDLSNDPPDDFVMLEFRAIGEDEFGNVQDPEETCVYAATVRDCAAPTTWFTLIHETPNPNNLNPVCDPPTNGSTPNPYYYRDFIGPLQVPRGPAIDIWALFSPDEGPATCTHDVLRVVFEYSLAGSGIWTPFATVTGQVNPDGQTVDLTLPVAVTLETEALETGTYDIRVYSCDLEGNNCTPADMAPTAQYDIAKITIVEEGLRAYIQPVICNEEEQDHSNWIDLYAINWIHDTYINKVLFQYYEDSDGDGVDNDGNRWYDIATDDALMLGDPRGDIVLRRSWERLDEVENRIAFVADGDTVETFIDYDGDGYSERDPIIRHEIQFDGDMTFNPDNDVVVLGDEDEILGHGLMDLTLFEEDEFHSGEGWFDQSEWIFKENLSQVDPDGTGGNLEKWHVGWDVSGIDEGQYLVRAVATDDLYTVDDTTSSPSAIPVEAVSIDALAPIATVTTVTTPDGDSHAAVNDLYFDGATGWLKLCAESNDTDISDVVFQFRIPGHAVFGDWTDLDVNDDEDFYADIDGIPGLSAEDEIFLDSGTVPFVWDAGDILLYPGANGEMNADDMATPPRLWPNGAFYTAAGDTVFEEDGVGDPDDDNDGMSNEDIFNPEDWDGPYCVYFPIPNLGLISDTNVEFRAIATDQSCNRNSDEDAAPVVRLMIGETDTPETDVVWVKLSDGSEIDFLPTISDGSDVTQLGPEEIAEPITLLVTAEDETAITLVDLRFRPLGACEDPELMEWDNPWMSMADFVTNQTEEDDPGTDSEYDFLFTVDLEALVAAHGYGVYEFYAEAHDNEGNVSPVQVNPYRFKLMTNEAMLTGTPMPVAPGEEFWFEADLLTPEDQARVEFLYAERVLDVVIDASRITAHPSRATYQTLPLALAMVKPGASAVVTIDGVAGDYYPSWEELVAEGGEGDWTYNGSAIEFAVRPASDAVILASYNVTGYDCLYPAGSPGSCPSMDDDAPYTNAWDQMHGGVPYPTVEGTMAYDVIARLIVNTDNECMLMEPLATENFLLMLEDNMAPNAHLWAGGLWNEEPGLYYPGNPSFDSEEAEEGSIEWKMSGVEHEFFVTSDSSDVATVELTFDGPYRDAITVPMTEIEDGTEYVNMTFTLYESDFPEVRYGFENVALRLAEPFTKAPQPAWTEYPMAEVLPGIWQVSGVPIPTGEESPYSFAIDQDGNDWDSFIADPRNQMEMKPDVPKVDEPISLVSVPPAPFWYASGPDLGDVTAVWEIGVTITDEDGNVGVNRMKWDGKWADLVYDPVPPTVTKVEASSVRFGAGEPVYVTALVNDPVPADFNAISVASVRIQYSPNYLVSGDAGEPLWLEFGWDLDRTDGWSVLGSIPDPLTDGFDNDGDGDYDEADPDEAMSTMAFRVLALDDGHNYSDPLAEAAILQFTLDEVCPTAVLTSPAEGSVWPYGSTIELAATAEGDDVHHVLFQFNRGEGWEDVDITPEDNTDANFDAIPPYAVSFKTSDYLLEEDSYVRFRAVPMDHAGNQCEELAEEVLVVVNDITGPAAFVLEGRTTGGADYIPVTDPALALHGPNASLRGVAVDPSTWENIATVTVQYQAPGSSEWVTISVDNDLANLPGMNIYSAQWEVDWDTHPLPEGVYLVHAVAADVDGNVDPEPVAVAIRVDNTPPTVLYDPMGSAFSGFAPFVMYENDGAPGQSPVITPDPETRDLTMMIATPDADIESIILQWRRDDEDDLGEWNDEPEYSTFDYEPNLTFDFGGTTYYVWRFHIDNAVEWAELAGMSSGVYEIRALATDRAGNANILHDAHNPWRVWTVDIDDPFATDFHHNLTDDSVAAGEDVLFNFVLSDSTTDVVVARLEYRAVESGDPWTVIDPDPETEGIDVIELAPAGIDTPNATWTGSGTWRTPAPLTRDTAFQVRVVFYDSAFNEGEEILTINVEDNIAPEFTTIWAIPAEVKFIDQPVDSDNNYVYDVDCEMSPEDEGSLHDGLFIDVNGNGSFDLNTDRALDYGAFIEEHPDTNYVLLWDWPNHRAAQGTIGNPGYTWPRMIDEVVLKGLLEAHEQILVSHTVTIVGRTQEEDDGIERVEFYAIPGDGEPILIGTDECPPAYEMSRNNLWHVIWNTLELDNTGAAIYPDGIYTLVARAYDLEGNVEVWDLNEGVDVTVDNTAPEATADASLDPGIQTTTTVERNDVLTLLAETDLLAGQQDDEVAFYVKRATDLNMDAAWSMVPSDEGLDASDVNPDPTRPYSFDWDLDKMDVPFPLEDPVVGVQYHMAASAADILMNAEGVTEAFDVGRYITFTVVDTRAPVATIVYAQRATGNTEPIRNPHLMEVVHARDFAELKARILAGDNDTERVEFMWALPGDTTPQLIDAQVSKDPDDPWTWIINDWDLRALAGQTIEVFAVATDDVGNVDFDTATGRPINGPVFRVFVDFEAPEPVVVTPYDNMKECRADSDFGNVYYDLIFTSTDTDIDIDSIVWEFKYSVNEDVEGNWMPCDSSGAVVFDANTGTYADKWYIGDEHGSGWKDVRLTFSDWAGNEFQQIVATHVILDVEDPWGEITNVVVNGVDNFPTHMIDVTLGDVITLWATADDIEEEALGLGTGVKEILFQARAVEGDHHKDGHDGPDEGPWRDLGFWQAPDETIYEQVVASIDWNTTGLDEGEYEARILIHDEECNDYESALVNLFIRDLEPPRARIAGFDPCMVPHGDGAPVYVDVYATAYSDHRIDEVQFQYGLMENGDVHWIPFGLSDDDRDGHHDEICNIWHSRMDLRDFEVGQQMLMRAIATDSDDNQDPNPPTVAVEVVAMPDGSLDLVPTQNLPQINGMSLSMVGGDCPDELVVTVKMAAADQRPLVLYVYPDVWGPDPIGYCSSAECVNMEAMIDNPQPDGFYYWRGVADLPDEDNCGRMTFFANALACEPGYEECAEIDLQSTYIWSREVTNALGTNGWHIVPGYVAVDGNETVDYLHAGGYIPSGNGIHGREDCLFIAQSTDEPGTNADQGRFMTMLDRTSYFVNLISDEEEFDDGYLMSVSIEYDDAALLAAVGGDSTRAAAMEQYITPRVFDTWDDDDSYWEGWEIGGVQVDTEHNRVTFQTKALECWDAFYALFVPRWDAPVSVLNFTPSSPFTGRWNYTDRSPVIVADLNTTGIEEIAITTVEVWIDGQLVAATLPREHQDGEGGPDGPENDPTWVRGNGTLMLERKNADGTMFQITYSHATEQAYWLRHGEHKLDVCFKTAWGVDEWVHLPDGAFGSTFFVDADAPFVAFHGGFTSNPRLHNVSGYINPAQMSNMLTVALFDDDAGVLVRPTDVECNNCDECNCNLQGIKYDLWLVHDEDDQAEIDEIEERVLLHSGTADELIPYMVPTYTTPGEAGEGFYTPADTLYAGLPIMAGGLAQPIGDGDVLEVTLYTKKHIELADDWHGGCEAGLIIGDFDFDDLPDTLGTIYVDCHIDASSRMHIYDQGILDWAGNAGSKYVEQRFIVDMTPPRVVLISPAGGFTEPGQEFCFEAEIVDEGAGIASATAILRGPNGEEIPMSSFSIDGRMIRGCVEGGLDTGHYTLVVTATDLTGNEAVLSIPIVVESRTLSLSDAYIYPNPVNPDDFEAIIHFNLSRHADITAKVYDFAGEEVATLADHEPYGAGTHGDLRWAGQADDGTDLANGAYMIRVEAFDGSARKSATIKAVIWRE